MGLTVEQANIILALADNSRVSRTASVLTPTEENESMDIYDVEALRDYVLGLVGGPPDQI